MTIGYSLVFIIAAIVAILLMSIGFAYNNPVMIALASIVFILCIAGAVYSHIHQLYFIVGG